ncbi:hypothetical protein HanLR1_Chr05g0177481 [Helianthus annuus]|nr:hypothetical protein HanLR1_Chr05g0177481 [Helianthus annuus]
MQLRCIVLHIISLLIAVAIKSVSSICEFSIIQENKLYSYSLASASASFPHGVLSEDGGLLSSLVNFDYCFMRY